MNTTKELAQEAFANIKTALNEAFARENSDLTALSTKTGLSRQTCTNVLDFDRNVTLHNLLVVAAALEIKILPTQNAVIH